MAERYINIKYLSEMWTKDCPVFLQKGALLYDSVKEKNLLQLKFENITNKRIRAIEISINCFSVGKDLIEIVKHSYLDINLGGNENVGEKSPIYLTNNDSRDFEIVVNNIYFNKDEHKEYNYILKTVSFNSLKNCFGGLSAELLRLYNRNIDRNIDINSAKEPQFFDENSWSCICGQLNLGGHCVNCQVKREYIEKLVNREYLAEELAKYNKKEQERTEKEREEKLRLNREFEEKRHKKNRIIKRIAVIAGSITAVICVFCFGYSVISLNRIKSNAEKALADGQYEKAIELYQTINETGKYDDDIKDCYIQKVIMFIDAKDFDNAASLYESIKEEGQYVDDIKECYQQKAEIFVDLEEYDDAISVYQIINENREYYGDIMECSYQKALRLLSFENYDTALEIFESLYNYKDSTEQKKICMYNQYYKNAIEEAKKGDYEKAIDSLDLIPIDFKDKEQLLGNYVIQYAQNLFEKTYYIKCKECLERYGFNALDLYYKACYQAAKEYMNRKDYENAISALEICKNYEDAEDLLAFCTEKNNEIKKLEGWYYIELTSKEWEIISIKYVGGQFKTNYFTDSGYDKESVLKNAKGIPISYSCYIKENGNGMYSAYDGDMFLFTYKYVQGGIQIINIGYGIHDKGFYKSF